ncbi:MAG: DUF4892 domain-containing protein [Paracoccus sp. (in: a-proteobacteria)]|nr:DUF4892 domain-containing protein [Paracoccus sp. (in: a-proteobacteria)]
MMFTRLVAVLTAFFMAMPVLAQDVAGSSDNPLIPRYEGSAIRAYSLSEFNDYDLVLSGTERDDATGNMGLAAPAQVIEGKVTHLLYRAPRDRSSLEVLRNYEAALKAAGFETLFTCAKTECGHGFKMIMNPGTRYNGLIYDEQQRYLAAKLTRPEGDVYVALYVTTFEPENLTYAQLDVIEVAGMEDRMAVVQSGEMEAALARDGKIAIYGILFDFDSAQIQPASDEQIGQLAALLTGNPDLEVLIVGHTDGQGAFDYNLGLSQRRAQAVADVLTARHGIAAARLTPAGAGMVAPVATNRTEEGRQQNRRVEIVERVSR